MWPLDKLDIASGNRNLVDVHNVYNAFAVTYKHALLLSRRGGPEYSELPASETRDRMQLISYSLWPNIAPMRTQMRRS